MEAVAEMMTAAALCVFFHTRAWFWLALPCQWRLSALLLVGALLLLLIESQNNSAAVVASSDLDGQLPSELLSSTAISTMGLPLREGARYRQASVDALDRLAVVLNGGEDPGPPQLAERMPIETNIPTREETQSSNAFLWVVVLLVVGTLVPMITWWVFSR